MLPAESFKSCRYAASRSVLRTSSLTEPWNLGKFLFILRKRTLNTISNPWARNIRSVPACGILGFLSSSVVFVILLGSTLYPSAFLRNSRLDDPRSIHGGGRVSCKALAVSVPPQRRFTPRLLTSSSFRGKLSPPLPKQLGGGSEVEGLEDVQTELFVSGTGSSGIRSEATLLWKFTSVVHLEVLVHEGARD